MRIVVRRLARRNSQGNQVMIRESGGTSTGCSRTHSPAFMSAGQWS